MDDGVGFFLTGGERELMNLREGGNFSTWSFASCLDKLLFYYYYYISRERERESGGKVWGFLYGEYII